MTPEDALLRALPVLALTFGLVLCRVGMVVMLMPGLGESSSPVMVRAGIAACLTLLVVPLAQAGFGPQEVAGVTPLRLAGMGSVEVLVGGLIGWLARLSALILPVTGQLISLLTGLSSVLQPDPELGASAAVLGRFFSLAAPVMLLLSGAYVLPLRALTGSYVLVPLGWGPGGLAHMPLLMDATKSVVLLTSRMFLLSMQLVAPFLLFSLLWQGALAILSRIVPNLQVYSLAMPLGIFGGVALTALMVQRILTVWIENASTILSGLPGL
ncbi:flagellar biosynthetic protein FliR [Acidomonas methanolica]|uniref:flagellar biosynthetic protein FliR n=1 Tax=Acidomonas methanolica TaxID=437 RepID=UPI00211A90DF|nr:flagellar biosynthetic protein FliR [Acidomonas methanolica]MCQ9154006.1 flagellar biosynthetic protein FliR [Acidomonas methanolica]